MIFFKIIIDNKFLKIFILVNLFNFIPLKSCSQLIHEFSKEFCKNPIYLMNPEKKISEFKKLNQIFVQSKVENQTFNDSLK